jgi:hypothetical protein
MTEGTIGPIAGIAFAVLGIAALVYLAWQLFDAG